ARDHGDSSVQRAHYEILSITVPVPTDEPQHIVMKASVASRRSSSCSAVTISREPVAPTGWPSAIAPPFGFTLLMSGSKTFAQDSTTDANASLISIRSNSPTFMPVL